MRFSIDNRVTFVLAALLALAGCSPLAIYNAAVPHDGGARLSAKDVPYGAGPRRKLDIYTPTRAESPAAPPIVLFIYGGSWRMGSKERYAFLGRALAAQGVITVIADYRLVPEVHYPDFVEDTAAATAWVLRNTQAIGGDPDRVFLMGHSAGAYNAVLTALDRHYLKAEASTPDRLAGVIGISGPYAFDPAKYPVTRAAFAGFLEDPSVKPISHVRADAPPMLLLHGEADDTVYPKNTRELAAALSGLGASVETKLYPDLGHAGSLLAFSRPLRNTAPVLSDVLAFIKTH